MQNAWICKSFFFSSRGRHTRCSRDWSSDVCSSDLFTAISLVGISLTLVILVVPATVFDNTFGAAAPESRMNRMLFCRFIGMYGPESSYGTNPGFGFLNRTIRNLPGAEDVSVYSEASTAVIYDHGRRIEAQQTRTDGAYWRILDFPFLEGGPITADDDTPDRLAAGRSMNMGVRNYRVVGVVAPIPVTRLAAWSEIWTPIGALSAQDRAAFGGSYNGMVLANSRGDFKQLKREFALRVAREPIADPKEYKAIRAGLAPPFEAFARPLPSPRG